MKKIIALLLCALPLAAMAQKTHTVAAKETLFSIGRLYNVHPRALAEYNHIPFDKGLSLGQVLKIPSSAAPMPQTAATTAVTEKLTKSEEEKGWWSYFPIYKPENKLIGSGGYKGKPTTEGVVEIGYEIAPAFRNRGLATEMAKGLIENALKDKRVQTIIAHTLAEDNPSTKVLQKCGFEKVQEINDPEDGLIWKY